MANRTKQAKKRMLEALEQNLGVVTTAARQAGVSRERHYHWLKADDEYRAKVEELEDVSLDFAESQLFRQIRDGNTSATIFFLKTKGQRRGYIEKQQFEQVDKDMSGIQIEIVEPNN